MRKLYIFLEIILGFVGQFFYIFEFCFYFDDVDGFEIFFICFIFDFFIGGLNDFLGVIVSVQFNGVGC